ncbi:MAG: hypothetical protein WA941_23585 [Nitrososphaeraceae archaeon]
MIHKVRELLFNPRVVRINTLFLIAAMSVLSIVHTSYVYLLVERNSQTALALLQTETTAITQVSIASGNPATGTTTDTTSYNNTFLTFNNPLLGTEIQYPPDWTITQHSLRDIFVTQFISPVSGESDELPAAVTVSAGVLPTNITSLDQYSNYIDEILKLVYRGGVNVTGSNNSTTLAGTIPAYERSFAVQQISLDKNLAIIPLDLRIIKLYGISGNNVYEITYTAEASKFDTYLPIVKRMTDSFRVDSSNLANAPVLGG